MIGAEGTILSSFFAGKTLGIVSSVNMMHAKTVYCSLLIFRNTRMRWKKLMLRARIQSLWGLGGAMFVREIINKKAALTNHIIVVSVSMMSVLIAYMVSIWYKFLKKCCWNCENTIKFLNWWQRFQKSQSATTYTKLTIIRGHSFSMYAKIFRETNISYLLIRSRICPPGSKKC